MSTRVIIADPDLDRRDRIRAACAAHDVRALGASSGAEALELAIAEVPDLLVATGHLAWIEGEQLISILRTNPRTRRIRTLFACGADAQPGAARLMWNGAPLAPEADPEEIAEAIAAALRRDADPAPAPGAVEEIEGRLSQIPLADLLQLFHLNRRSGSFEITRRAESGRPERGRIVLARGDVVHAVAGIVEGEKALFRLFTWEDAQFAFRAEDVQLKPRIASTTRALLLEGMRQLDEWKRHKRELPPLDGYVALRLSTHELPSGVHPLTQEVLLLLELYTRVDEIVDHASYPDYQVLRTLQTLVRRGIVELRVAPPAAPPEAGVFHPAQIHRLREWARATRPEGSALRDAKVLVSAATDAAFDAFLQLLAQLPGVQLPRIAPTAERVGPQPLARLRVDDEFALEFVHISPGEGFAPLWPLAGQNALGALLLLSAPDAGAEAVLRPLRDALRELPGTRLFHLFLLPPEAGSMADQVRSQVELAEDSEVFFLPLDRDERPAELLRSAVARLTP